MLENKTNLIKEDKMEIRCELGNLDMKTRQDNKKWEDLS